MIDQSFWRGRRVLVTGHTGFKGAWTSLLLTRLGAEVHGFALAPDSDDGVFVRAGVRSDVVHRIGDVRDAVAVQMAVDAAAPDIVLHLAAQALVRLSYAEPLATYATNVMGVAHVLEAARRAPSVRAVVVVTSDKCYENVGSLWGYRETDPMGGYDPYSNSKGCAELVTSAYRRSFFSAKGAAQIASGRAGNVIGGGDWSPDRLVPDAVRAFSKGQALQIRNPAAVRPWQHVLDPVLAYLLLAERLTTGEDAAEGWNFGPNAASEVPVRRVVDTLVGLWGAGAAWEHDRQEHAHEAAYLKLDCTKAAVRLGWRPLIDLDEALAMTVGWYKASLQSADMRTYTLNQIDQVLDRASGGKTSSLSSSRLGSAEPQSARPA